MVRCVRRGSRARTAGWILMLAGTILLILSLPSWFWFTGLGLLLGGVGYLLWRFL